jgi:2-polyprenyl-3-methyl-5-hydroxy-6-metoxy-1,4-benzoquinol methylase
MATTAPPASPPNSESAAEQRRDALTERLFGAVLGMADVHLVYLGDRLGYYRELASGWRTSTELAEATGTHERYAREWLEQQAVSGIIEVDDAAKPASERRFHLPEGHDEVLLDSDSFNYMSAFARMMVGIVRPLPKVIEAFRTGGGVPYAHYDKDFCEGQGDMNRVNFINLLGSEWLPALPDIHERLRQPGARIADVACGTGWSTIALARAYPEAQIEGIDLDEASIASAKRLAKSEGLTDRVTFRVGDGADPKFAGHFHLVTLFEALHDLSRPVEVLSTLRSLLAPGGAVLVADEKVAESFVAPGDEVEQAMYAFSVLHCLPSSMVDEDSAATGTAMRIDTARDYATRAGFSRFEVLPVSTDFWRLYRLDP